MYVQLCTRALMPQRGVNADWFCVHYSRAVTTHQWLPLACQEVEQQTATVRTMRMFGLAVTQEPEEDMT